MESIFEIDSNYEDPLYLTPFIRLEKIKLKLLVNNQNG